jgi:hypothetical protein
MNSRRGDPLPRRRVPTTMTVMLMKSKRLLLLLSLLQPKGSSFPATPPSVSLSFSLSVSCFITPYLLISKDA